MDLLNCPQQCVCLRKRWSEIVTSKYKAQSILQNTTHVWGAQFSSLTGLVLSNQLEVWGRSSINILNTNSTTNQHTKKAHLKKRGTSLLALQNTEWAQQRKSGKWGIWVSTAYHPAWVWLDCLQLLKLFNLALIYIVLQLPGAVLVR